MEQHTAEGCSPCQWAPRAASGSPRDRLKKKEAWPRGQAFMFPSGLSVGDREPPLRLLVERGLRAIRMLEHDAQPLLRHREPRGDRALGDAQSLRDRAVGVTVVVAEHDRRR